LIAHKHTQIYRIKFGINNTSVAYTTRILITTCPHLYKAQSSGSRLEQSCLTGPFMCCGSEIMNKQRLTPSCGRENQSESSRKQTASPHTSQKVLLTQSASIS